MWSKSIFREVEIIGDFVEDPSFEGQSESFPGTI